MEFRVLTQKEQETVRLNVSMMERRAELWDRKCAECNFPMIECDSRFSALWTGEVCGVCREIYRSVAYKTYWMNLHTEWVNRNKNKDSNTL